MALARAVAVKVIAYRSEHGLSQTALAKRLGMSQPAVARLESGEHNRLIPPRRIEYGVAPRMSFSCGSAAAISIAFLKDEAP